MGLLLLLTFIVLIGSAIFSGSEAALFSVSDSRVHVLKKNNERGAKALAQIKEKISRPITVIVIGNNIINIVGSMYIGVVAAEHYGEVWIGVISALLTILIIIFGEIVPKTLGEHYDEKVALFVSPILLWATRVLSPIIFILEQFTKHLSNDEPSVSEEDLQMMSEIGHAEGSIEADERALIERVFTLNDIEAWDIMTPRTMITAFDKEDVLADIEQEIYELTNSRLPVYDEEIDNIVGVCLRRELLIALAKDQKDRKISDFVQDALFVREEIKLDDLLPLFQKNRAHLAIVQDEFGGTAGVVSLEDVLEQLVGEIVDETDEVVDTRAAARRMNR
jgi:CBS domain containing-hemolysin-like protein